MKTAVLVLFALVAVSSWGLAEPWVLQRGPDEVAVLPLDPPQPVGGWKGLYRRGGLEVSVYLTRSPYFVRPVTADTVLLPGTWGTVWAVFPADWTSARRGAWLGLWRQGYIVLATLPGASAFVAFPALLTEP